MTTEFEDGSVPLELATEDQLRAELGRRYTNFVLVIEEPGPRGQELCNRVIWWAAPATRLGLLEYARLFIQTDVQEYAKSRGEDDEDMYHED